MAEKLTYAKVTAEFDEDGGPGVFTVQPEDPVMGERPSRLEQIEGADPVAHQNIMARKKGRHRSRGRLGSGVIAVIEEGEASNLLVPPSVRVMNHMAMKFLNLTPSGNDDERRTQVQEALLGCGWGHIGMWRDGGAGGIQWMTGGLFGVTDEVPIIAHGLSEFGSELGVFDASGWYGFHLRGSLIAPWQAHMNRVQEKAWGTYGDLTGDRKPKAGDIIVSTVSFPGSRRALDKIVTPDAPNGVVGSVACEAASYEIGFVLKITASRPVVMRDLDFTKKKNTDTPDKLLNRKAVCTTELPNGRVLMAYIDPVAGGIDADFGARYINTPQDADEAYGPQVLVPLRRMGILP